MPDVLFEGALGIVPVLSHCVKDETSILVRCRDSSRMCLSVTLQGVGTDCWPVPHFVTPSSSDRTKKFANPLRPPAAENKAIRMTVPEV